MTDGWFGPWTYNEGEAEGSPFLEAVRSLAPQKLASLIEPEDTVVSSYPVAPFVLLTVEVALSEEPSSIDIDMLYDGRSKLSAHWGGDGSWDYFDPKHPESLVVQAPAFSAEQFAALGLDWIATQLTRPVIEKQWLKHGQLAARAWVLGDTGNRIEVSGRRPFRAEPSVVRTVRIGALTIES